MSTAAATLLIVDDEPHIRKLLGVLLQNQGYRTLTASSGEEALAMVEQQPPDLILLDVMMPGMDGYEVARLLKADKETCGIPIIMLTALGEHSARLSGLAAGAEDFLSKPVESVELWLRVRNLLRLKSFGDYLKSHSLMLEEQLQKRTIDLERFRSAMNASGDAIFLINRSTMTLIEFNRRAGEVLGYTSDELLRITPAELSDASSEQLEQLYDTIISGSGPIEPEETRLHCKGGVHITVEIHRQAYRSADDWIIVCVARDISQRQQADQRILKMAHYDPVTGLPNRNLFFTTLQMGLTQAALSHWQLAVVTADLDDFKRINETWGHLKGDEVLAEIARRISECLNASDTLGRMDGDEFAIILIVREGQPRPQQVVERIQAALRAPLDSGGQASAVTASMGIALYPEDGAQGAVLIRHANTAMNRAKKQGGDSYGFYTAQMNVDALALSELQTELREAVKQRAFELFYQPKVDVTDGSVCGLEALLRWRRAGRPDTSPAVFVPLLQKLGLLVEVDKWVFRRVCQQMALWRQAGLRPLQVAVNVSSDQITEGHLITDIEQALSEHHIEPEWLDIELTESSLMENTSHTISTLHALQQLGVKISIDDFGTGYSSLAYLRRFPINNLKIDIAFIREVTTNPQDAAIARTIIELAHSLDLKVIAEGVETQAQLAFLLANGCDQAQGYLFSKPLPVDELEAFLSGVQDFSLE